MFVTSIRTLAGLVLIGTLPSLTASLAPSSLSILKTEVRECDYHITSSISPTNTSLDIFFDTTKSTGNTADALAWTDSVGANSSLCIVCATLKWQGEVYGQVTSIDYEFWHKLDLGLLEAVVSHIRRDNDTFEEWFETSYIYGSEESAVTQFVRTNVPNASEPLLLDYHNKEEAFCVQTTFVVQNRVGVEHAVGEISRRSVFSERVNLNWVVEKPAPQPPIGRS